MIEFNDICHQTSKSECISSIYNSKFTVTSRRIVLSPKLIQTVLTLQKSKESSKESRYQYSVLQMSLIFQGF